MNEYQTKLYNDLMTLCDTSESFFFKEETIGHNEYGFKTFRVFNYRLCSYSDFLNESAPECRGIMFEVDLKGNPIRLASLPMNKFWNYKENSFTENVDFSKTTHAMIKADGSLISTYMFNDQLMLKSKGSLSSEQAIDAMAWLGLPENELLKNELQEITSEGNTVNMEWTSEKNRIVLSYETPSLIVLNVRNNMDGRYFDNNKFGAGLCPAIKKHLVEDHLDQIAHVESFVESIPDMEGIEGYVIKLSDGQMIKIKTDWYVNLHKNKDSINSPKRLFKAIVGEEIDDIMSLFHDDPIALKIINDMIELVEPKFNHMISAVEAFHSANKELDRKGYAIKAKGLDDGLMGLYMNLYLKRENDYKGFAQKYHEMFIGTVEE
jgi:Straboviridae RNA ligase 1